MASIPDVADCNGVPTRRRRIEPLAASAPDTVCQRIVARFFHRETGFNSFDRRLCVLFRAACSLVVSRGLTAKPAALSSLFPPKIVRQRQSAGSCVPSKAHRERRGAAQQLLAPVLRPKAASLAADRNSHCRKQLSGEPWLLTQVCKLHLRFLYHFTRMSSCPHIERGCPERIRM
ncbi:hypothetical protein CPSG_05595 [Coccidioides posadasii str. Silveira]|uniref:Uncharacterized protein n=1 Tax=Coccidioides posadasii (strain RMSCC 757 / Silveira) TaxID=443226 RepID=E9D6T6_COCPS|nr:hypothetical protein CPSG_05595 [Coccidioides posadasii str. Silveira]